MTKNWALLVLSRSLLAPQAFVEVPESVTDQSAFLRVGLRGLVLAGLIAILMSCMSACYNSSATLVMRGFVLRFRPDTDVPRQVVLGRGVTALMAALGVLAAPLVGLSVTI